MPMPMPLPLPPFRFWVIIRRRRTDGEEEGTQGMPRHKKEECQKEGMAHWLPFPNKRLGGGGSSSTVLRLPQCGGVKATHTHTHPHSTSPIQTTRLGHIFAFPPCVCQCHLHRSKAAVC